MFGPREAGAYGIVGEVTPAGGAVERALTVAERIAGLPARAVAHCKRLVRLALETPLEEGLALERTLFLDLMTGDDAARLMAAMNRGERDIRD